MSVISKLFGSVKCDRCGDIISEEWYDDIEDCKDALIYDCNWIELNGKHYCPDCYYYDEETDELKVREEENLT